MSDRKLSEDLQWDADNAREVERTNNLVMVQAHVFQKWADRAAALEAENERLRVDAERYRALRDRHFENLPGDSAILWNGSQYEDAHDTLDALADAMRDTPAGEARGATDAGETGA